MRLRYTLALAFGLLAGAQARAQQVVKILFDATKAQTAGNADWVIDSDVSGSPQRLPTPAQSTVTASTPETYWTGALSSWGIALVKRGYQVETLPSSGRITYNDATNAQDLRNYAAYIVDEPNTRYTAAEKTAILNYVRNGGGLFMISDHTISDRNGDGWDSPAIWNDLMASASPANPFGITFDLNNLVFTTGVGAATAPTDSLLHGPAGNPVAMEYHNGASLTLSPTANASVRGVLFRPGAATTGTTGAIVARARYGRGRVVALGDSSPPDDGSGAPGNNLYDGWAAEANGDHARILLNATIWLATPNRTTTATRVATEADFSIYPNPSTDAFFISGNVLPTEIRCHNAVGQEFAISSTAAGAGALRVQTAGLAPGLYVLSLRLPNGQVLTRRIARQ
ncbi:T9SS type A sorting domain-containing protein [Microvirga sp. STS02]|uniref:T9SS type A sorting domain-containing protein n=1 Tax=Hymenobacter negativus TaxID=2795026 RepID=UPI0018DD3154|nr:MULTISPECIES: T9SS type A sorting domain-containing protein [Bacteria]MBH8569941.1 T9SS type A sorting domain-containing protein [Hymenobacter negativus]MBR7209680.1 T9SS type A sorting domain-containing protein [Microvirga sp. STS02]